MFLTPSYRRHPLLGVAHDQHSTFVGGRGTPEEPSPATISKRCFHPPVGQGDEHAGHQDIDRGSEKQRQMCHGRHQLHRGQSIEVNSVGPCTDPPRHKTPQDPGEVVMNAQCSTSAVAAKSTTSLGGSGPTPPGVYRGVRRRGHVSPETAGSGSGEVRQVRLEQHSWRLVRSRYRLTRTRAHVHS